MATREESLATLESLGVAAVFTDSYRTKELPARLNIFFGPPEEFFLAPETQVVYTHGHLVPLLDDGNFGLVIFYDPESTNIIQMDVEVPDDSRCTFTSWQQYLAHLFIGIAESSDDDVELAQIADIIGFQHMQRTLEFMDADDDGDWGDRCSEFVASL
ncbi:MAG: hypothetical protein IH991_03925 [Planctomycetes bacterium]|nr:hypothetical protein [Planctomycetota bacterium]